MHGKGGRKYYYVSRNFPAQGRVPCQATAGVCQPETSKVESQPRSRKCSATSRQFLRLLRKLTLTPARSIAYSTPREPGVTAFQSEAEQISAIGALVDRVDLKSDG